MSTTERDPIFDKPTTYELLDGRVVYRASSLGFCPGALVRSRLGITPSPPPENIERAWAAGRDNEAALVARGLEQIGYKAVNSRVILGGLPGVRGVVETDAGLQVEVQIEVGKRAVVLCHPDGIAMKKGAVKGDEKMVVEAKLLSQSYWDQITRGGGVPAGLTETYSWQVSVEAHATGLDVIYIIGVKEEDGTWDAADGKVVVFQVKKENTPYTIEQIKTRVLEIEGYVHRGDMPTCPEPKMWPCPWWKEHDDDRAEVETVEDELLESLAARYKDLGDQMDVLKAQREAARDGILKWYADTGRASGDEGRVEVGGLRVVRVAGGEGNVSWKGVWESVKYEHKDMDLEQFRGKPTNDSVRVERIEG